MEWMFSFRVAHSGFDNLKLQFVYIGNSQKIFMNWKFRSESVNTRDKLSQILKAFLNVFLR